MGAGGRGLGRRSAAYAFQKCCGTWGRQGVGFGLGWRRVPGVAGVAAYQAKHKCDLTPGPGRLGIWAGGHWCGGEGVQLTRLKIGETLGR